MFGDRKDIVFIDDIASIGSVLKMLPSGRNDASTVAGMDAYSKSPSFDIGENIEKCEERGEIT